jgi:chemosensory pili system protein ChpA (sensor histidine kinase/response regulator)
LILDVAEESLDTLGYSLTPRPSILDVPSAPEPEAVSAPSADPFAEIDSLAAEAADAVVEEQAVPEPVPLDLAAPMLASALDDSAVEQTSELPADSEPGGTAGGGDKRTAA